ncbi:hypothetical protein Sango_2830100 [Sesamum angolense]|uniref:RNase H type-1 domain-containing protein n=1 Tax=Sesamum angolense TaxID=2727404 RepID=A0AAE1VZN9_9LAMI|nr:hypothetical protein Sango_2830100 [Sesamum angolense]
MTLALVITVRRLCPYFLSHPIGVMMNLPLKQTWETRYFWVIGEMSSRIEQIRHLIPTTNNYRSSRDLEFAIKFGFKYSNNEAEYEALVIGMKMAHEVGARHLVTYSDSQLIVKQVEDTYEAKEESMQEGMHVLKEVHCSCCGAHAGTWALANKALRTGYFWPTMKQDACQMWGMDIVGPFPMAPGQRKFLLVAIDYFTKWVEAKPLARIIEEEIVKFIWRNIICHFGLP